MRQRQNTLNLIDATLLCTGNYFGETKLSFVLLKIRKITRVTLVLTFIRHGFFFSFLLFTTKQNVFPIKIQNILMRKQLCKCLRAKLVQNEIDKNLLFRLNASRKESGALVSEVTSEI